MDTILIVVALGVIGLAMYGLAYATHHRYGGAGHDSFAVFTASLATGAIGAALAFATGLGFDDAALYVAVQSPIALATVPWFVFAVRYVGRGDLVSDRHIAALGVPIVLFVIVHVVWIAVVGDPDRQDLFIIAWWIAIMYQFGLLFAGIAFLLRVPAVSARVAVRPIVMLTIPALVPPLIPMSGPILAQSASENAGFGSYVVGFLVCAVAITLSIYRYDTLGSAAAAAGTIGREVLLRELDDAILVADDRGQLVELNDAARETFDASKSDVLGETFESLTGVAIDDLATDDTVTLETTDGVRRFDAQTSELTDTRGRRYGVAVSLRDVTRRDLREQRIRILNRVLRHNLRNKLTVVRGSAEVIPESDEATRYAQLIVETSDELLELGEQARTIETILREQWSITEPTPVESTVERVVTDAREAFPNVTFETAVRQTGRVRANARALEYVLWELVENAAIHNDTDAPRIDVTVGVSDETSRIRVSVVDNGPGIPAEELTAIRRGEESPLEHASGLDLWAIYWVVVLHGGELSFEDNDPRGTIVRVDLPQASTVDESDIPAVAVQNVTGEGD